MPDQQQYFASQPESASQARAFELPWQGRTYRFWTDSGVFSRGELDMGTRVLLGALPGQITGRVLDLGCGWGPVGVLLSAQHPQAEVVLADVNERAVALANRNARENGVSARAVVSDGLAQLTGQFDLIALNPPIRAGKEVVYSLFAQAAKALTPDGALYVVIRKQQGAPSAKAYINTLFHDVRTIARKGGYHVFQCSGGKTDAV
ncbi:MAG: methyltransferase [Clostridiales bacterium]|mgnify:CR=1 FL=1|nr:methyltransferase [Clostridiales bacterium]